MLIVRHFAGHAAHFWCSLFFPFSDFRMESRLHCSLASAFNKKENDNDANGSGRDCLAESETTSTSATLGADQQGFKDDSLSGPGMRFHSRRFVLDHYVELGISARWSSSLVVPRGRHADVFRVLCERRVPKNSTTSLKGLPQRRRVYRFLKPNLGNNSPPVPFLLDLIPSFPII